MATFATALTVKKLVSAAVFDRAEEIASSDKIREIVFEGDNLNKGRAECIGSLPSDLYDVNVSINGATAAGRCSCPAGKSAKDGICKHVVALMLRRVQEIPASDANPPSHAPEDNTISISSQIDDNLPSALESISRTARGETSTTSGISGLPPNAKRALPTWMLGVVGSATVQDNSSNSRGSKKRAAPPKPPRSLPPPIKRTRRVGPPRISNVEDDITDYPGEVEDSRPMKELSAQMVEDLVVEEPVCISSDGAAARKRRRLKKDETEVIAGVERNDVSKRTRGQSNRSVTKLVEDQPVHKRKGRRLVKKSVQNDSDISENEAPEVDENVSSCMDLTDDDFMFLAQEQVERQKEAQHVSDPGGCLQTSMVDENQTLDKSAQSKKSDSIFSMNKWKEFSTAVPATAGMFSPTTNVLKSRSQPERPGLDNPVENTLHPSMQTSREVSGLQNIAKSLSIKGDDSASDQADEVANDMLDLLFGPSLSQTLVSRNEPAASSAQVNPVPTTASSATERFGSTAGFLATGISTDDLLVEPKPKKKSSLKDTVKMLLT